MVPSPNFLLCSCVFRLLRRVYTGSAVPRIPGGLAAAT